MPSSSHRSRIRQRQCSSADHRSSPAASITTATALSYSLILLLFNLPTPSSASAYLGPTHCTKPGTGAAAVIQSTSLGYSTFNHLLFDMVSLSTAFQSGHSIPEERLTFRICPGTTLDLDDTSLPLGFLPISVPRLTLQCGQYGNRGTNDVNTGRNDACTIRGGGKRNLSSKSWNTDPEKAFEDNGKFGILGGGEDSIAQIYVDGESAYEITLRGLTFDNSLTREEVQLYKEYTAKFGSDAESSGSSNGNDDGFSETRGEEKIEQEYDASVPSNNNEPNKKDGGYAADQITVNRDNIRARKLQGEAVKVRVPENDSSGNGGGGVKPAHRFASVAVRGKGYGDDAGPRLITIEDCKFTYHRGYAVLVSPGIQQPGVPVAPELDFPQRPSSMSGNNNGTSVPAPANVQSSGEIYNGGSHLNIDKEEGEKEVQVGVVGDGDFRRRTTGRQKQRGRNLNLLDNERKFISQDGRVSYYDHATSKNYLDGRRVKIIKTEFANNIIAGENVAGLVTSAYSLTLTDCFFSKNSAKAMVFVYNNEALVDNTIFAENTVEVSTVIMASPKGSKPLVEKIKNNNNNNNGGGDDTLDATTGGGGEPTHIVERTCFLGSHVGMSNVLVTDIENTGFGQRDNHAKGTEFSWVSTCEGGAAESLGNDCIETGNCDGTCVRFTSDECLAERVNSLEYDMFFNGAPGRHFGSRRRSVLNVGLSSLGTMLAIWMLS